MAMSLKTLAGFGKEFRPKTGFAPGRVRRLLGLWAYRRHERVILGEMDERMLHDVGIDWMAARREAARAFWVGEERQGCERRWPW